MQPSGPWLQPHQLGCLQALSSCPLSLQVNNATARVMTNKKAANPYTNGKGQHEKCQSRGIPGQHHCQDAAKLLQQMPSTPFGRGESSHSLPDVGCRPLGTPHPAAAWTWELQLLRLSQGVWGVPWGECPQPNSLSLPTGWKLNPVVGAVYGPEFYAGNVGSELTLPWLPPNVSSMPCLTLPLL